jgi:hypothetical protein
VVLPDVEEVEEFEAGQVQIGVGLRNLDARGDVLERVVQAPCPLA